MPTCPRCRGTGEIYNTTVERLVRCNVCFGTGSVSQIERTCTSCGGTGREEGIAPGMFNTQGKRCFFCYGSGKITVWD